MTGNYIPEAGKPWRWTWWQRLGLSAATLVAGTTLSQFAVYQGGLAWSLILPGWLLTTSALRSFTTSYIHHASHKNLIPPDENLDEDERVFWNDLLGESLSIMALAQNLLEYRKDHTEGHHPKLATLSDPDLVFLSESLGFRPGLSMNQYWRHLKKTMISPRYHFKFFWSRLKSNLVTPSRWRRAAGWAFYAALIALVVSNPLIWIISWILPLTLGYQISALLQVVTEHNYVRETKKGLKTMMKLTSNRYFGEALPTGRFRSLGWAIKMLALHLPQKLFVVATSDLANHDIHHVDGKGDWPNAAELRSKYLLENKHSENLTENWGVKAQLEATFQKLSELPLDAILGDYETYGKDLENSRFTNM